MKNRVDKTNASTATNSKKRKADNSEEESRKGVSKAEAEQVEAMVPETLAESSVYMLDGQYIKGEYVVKRLGVTEKTLITLAEGGEFAMGRVAGVMVIDTQSFFNYLNRVHFKMATSDNDEPAVDSKGKVKVGLTIVGVGHTDVPELKPVSEFAREVGLDDRTFIRHCDVGTFQHYRIGSLYKMSKEDFAASLEYVTKSGMKSNRGTKKSAAGRPNKVHQMMTDKAAELANK